MRLTVPFVVALPVLVSIVPVQAQERNTTFTIDGLERPVEIVIDRWGISHIYADTENDLFFAQGFNAARDRLFQLEIWRRQATGTTAEILGSREVERDIGTRLFRFRGDIVQEMNHYHPRGSSIIRAFVAGVNAYVAATERDPSLLPVEFELLGITPARWTPYDVISRHQGLLGNIGEELNFGRAVHAVGEETVKRLVTLEPGEPDMALDSTLDGSLLTADILHLYDAFRGPIRFRPEDIAQEHRNDDASFEELAALVERSLDPTTEPERETIGSNNWVVHGDLTQSGYPLMANDPHRAQSAPSLRYWVHLVGPGWNVIGGGEPEIPGISIGHNEYGAWGLTVFATDGEDLYVYETNPRNRNEYRYKDRWETMSVIRDTIAVRGARDTIVDLKYTRHGPVVFEDTEHNTAYAVRAAWMEIGGAPYLASLRMDQARTWEEFRDASNFSNIPGENMVWADRAGNIGWQAVGIAPIRPNWSGLVPVPGDGRYEWNGYLPITSKPNTHNPPNRFFATANNNLIPLHYPHRNAVGWEWSDPFRWARVSEVLANGTRHSVADMMALQADNLSIPARTLVPLLQHVSIPDPLAEQARRMLLDWDYRLDAQSVTAGIYIAWERRLQRGIRDLFVPAEARDAIGGLGMSQIIDRLVSPPGEFGMDPLRGRDEFLMSSLVGAIVDLRAQLGPEPTSWQYGQEDYKHALIRHPLSAAVNQTWRDRLNVGPYPRGGNSYTINNSGGGNNQTSGPSFRIIVDTGDWDRTVGANNPGQAGDPSDPHYADLIELWANDRYFPVFYSRDRVTSVSDRVVRLTPVLGR